MKNLVKTIALASTLISPIAMANDKLIAYCAEFSNLGVSLYENKQKGITFEQAALFNKLAMQSQGMHNEYAMATAMTIKIYSENLTKNQTRKLAYNGCVNYMTNKTQPR